MTERERAYLGAVRLLYGEGDKRARDAAYLGCDGEDLSRLPEGPRRRVLLCVVAPWPGGSGLSPAGASRRDCPGGLSAESESSGAAHYIIHAFDDPDHAILALPAARRYAEIAPEAHHARHMPSHIFLQLGMWPEAAASNEAARESSDAWMKRKKLSLSVRDYHSLHWLLYCYLQQGRYSQAEQLLT